MNLIEEIEAAGNFEDPLKFDADQNMIASHFIETPWWPRIKAALEAAQEMELQVRGMHEAYFGVHKAGDDCSVCDRTRKFRAAMEGK